MSLGAKVIPRTDFLAKLNTALTYKVNPSMWKPQKLDAIYE